MVAFLSRVEVVLKEHLQAATMRGDKTVAQNIFQPIVTCLTMGMNPQEKIRLKVGSSTLKAYCLKRSHKVATN